MSKEHCYYCNDMGTPEGCIHCGRKAGEVSYDDLRPSEVIKRESKFKSVLIPEYYRKTEWSSEVFWKSKSGLKSDMALQRFIGTLQSVYDMFVLGTVPNKSGIFIAPNGFGKCTFAYSCMKQALLHGHSVLPLTDTMDIKRLFVSSTTKPDFKLYYKWNLDDYVLKDVLFITVIQSRLNYDAYLTIADIVNKRSRFDKPTFIISEFTLKEISRWDDNKNYTNLNTATESDNPLKFPLVVEYKGVDSNGVLYNN